MSTDTEIYKLNCLGEGGMVHRNPLSPRFAGLLGQRLNAGSRIVRQISEADMHFLCLYLGWRPITVIELSIGGAATFEQSVGSPSGTEQINIGHSLAAC